MMSLYLTCFLKPYLSFTIVGICHVLPCMYRFSISAYNSAELSHFLAIDTNLERLIINNFRYSKIDRLVKKQVIFINCH